MNRRGLVLILALIVAAFIGGFVLGNMRQPAQPVIDPITIIDPVVDPTPEPDPEPVIDDNVIYSEKDPNVWITEDGTYDDKDHVALYIHAFGRLPSNYVTKKQAREKGWNSGSLEPYFPGCCIGGDYFGNNEGLLPKKKGRTYYECDIGTMGKKSRGEKRIVFSNDGLVYYTSDHYESYELLYEGE